MNRRRTIVVFLLCFFCFGVITARAMWEGHSALKMGDAFHQAKDKESAIRWWRRAARWYVPGVAHVSVAYNRLKSMALEAEENGQKKRALSAWVGIRSSVRATRSFYTPFKERAKQADLHIAHLMVSLEQADSQSVEVKSREAWHLARLKEDPMPSIFWSVISLLGLGLWILCGFLFAMRGLDNEDRLVPVAAAYCGAGIAMGLLIWLTGLHLA